VCPDQALSCGTQARGAQLIGERGQFDAAAQPFVLVDDKRGGAIMKVVDSTWPLWADTATVDGTCPVWVTAAVASIYRAPANQEKRQAYPEAVAQAHTDLITLPTGA